MRRAVQIAEFLFLLAMSAAIGYGIYWMHRIGPKAEVVMQQATAVELQASSTLNNARHLSMDERKKFDEQAEAMQGTVRRANRLLDHADVAIADLDTAIVTANENINRRILPKAADAVNAATDALVELKKQESGVGPILKSVDKATRDADAQIANPAIGQSLENISAGTKSLAGAAADVKKETDKFVAPATTPKKILHVLGESLKLSYYSLRMYFLPW